MSPRQPESLSAGARLASVPVFKAVTQGKNTCAASDLQPSNLFNIMSNNLRALSITNPLQRVIYCQF